MKRMLLLLFSFLSISSVAMADQIGVYSDAAGCNRCFAPGFLPTGYVIHKFAAGATASHFKVQLPAGSFFFAFNTSFTAVGTMTDDLTVTYGTCETGNFVIGTFTALLAGGPAAVVPANMFPSITYTNCLSAEVWAMGGTAIVGQSSDCNLCPVATEPSTWGRVKELYR